MRTKIWMPRLKPREVEDLTTCLTRLNQIHDSIDRTNIAGKPAVLQLTIEIYRVIEGVLGKVQNAVIAAQTRAQTGEALRDPPEDV